MWFPTLSSLTAAGALVALANARPQDGGSSSTACNNSPSLCDRAYNDVTFLGGHNSAFLRDESTGNSLSGNQYHNATRALDAGLRLLQAQVHQNNGSLTLCHSSCSLLDAGPLESWLAAIGDWMSGNPNEVVTILLVNAADGSPEDYASVFESAGLADMAYRPATFGATSDWPTLQTMIDNNERLVAFVTEITHSEAAPFILDELSYVFETHFEVTELSGFNCTLDRPTNQDTAENALSNGFLSLVNHFKYQQLGASIQLPDVDSIETVNDPGSNAGNIGLHLDTCNSEWGSRPNFVLVDFFDEGDPMAAVDAMNEVSDTTGRTDTADLGGDDESAANGLKSRGLEFGAFLAFFSAAILLV